VGGLDRDGIEPSILGTLVERSLDPSKRARLGAHYTSRENIPAVVEPVLTAPLRRRWAAVREQAERRDAASGGRARRINNSLSRPLSRSAEEIAGVRDSGPRLRFGELPERSYAATPEFIAFARADDYFLGVLHSRAHELWARRMGTWTIFRSHRGRLFTILDMDFGEKPFHAPR